MGHDTVFLQCVHNLFLHFPYGTCQPGKADAEVYDTGHVAYHRHFREVGDLGRYAQNQFEA